MPGQNLIYDNEALQTVVIQSVIQSYLALSILYINTEKEFRRIFEKLSDSAEIWHKLKQHFYPDNRARGDQNFTASLGWLDRWKKCMEFDKSAIVVRNFPLTQLRWNGSKANFWIL